MSDIFQQYVQLTWQIPILSLAFLHCLPPILPASSSTNEECAARRSPLVSSNEFTPRGDNALVWKMPGRGRGRGCDFVWAVRLCAVWLYELSNCASFVNLAQLCLIFCLSRGIWLIKEMGFIQGLDGFVRSDFYFLIWLVVVLYLSFTLEFMGGCYRVFLAGKLT